MVWLHYVSAAVWELLWLLKNKINELKEGPVSFDAGLFYGTVNYRVSTEPKNKSTGAEYEPLSVDVNLSNT